MSQQNVESARRMFAELGSSGFRNVDQVEGLLSDAALSEFCDPRVEWVPVSQSLLAVETYQGYEGVRRFWADFLSTWNEFSIVPEEMLDAGDQVAVVMRMAGRMDDIEIDELWSSLLTFRDGRVIRIQGFSSRDGALEAAGLSG